MGSSERHRTLNSEEETERGAEARSIATTSPSRGDVLSRYIVLEEIGRGAMGVVYAAYDPELDRKVALKVLHRGRERLLREAQALARLSSAYAVAIHDVGVSGGRLFLAMEYVDGESLDAWLGRGPHPWRDVLTRLLAAGRGLEAAHLAGVVHRDFKPANVLLAGDGGVKVADFGLARASGSLDGTTSTGSGRAVDLERLTATGELMGTPSYMAPEQHEGKVATEASDQFSFCVSLYRGLYGVMPFTADDLMGLRVAVLAGEVRPPPDNIEVPAGLYALVARGLSREPENRHASMTELLEGLTSYLRPASRGWLLGVAGVAAAAVVAVVVSTQGDRCADAARPMKAAWDEDDRRAVAAAFGRVDTRWGTLATRNVIEGVDRYAADWSKLRIAACEAAHGGPQAGERSADYVIACLDRGLVEVEATVEALREASVSTVAIATDLVHELPDPAGCGSAESGDAVPQPEDPQTRVEVARLRAFRARLHALVLAKASGDLAPQIDELVADATATQYGPLIADAHMLRGLYEKTNGRHDGAAESFHEALATALAADEQRIAALATSNLLELEGDSRGKHKQAEVYAALALAWRRRWVHDPELTSEIDGALALVYSSTGRYDEALARANSAAEAAERSGDPITKLNARGYIGMVQWRSGHYAEAIAAFTSLDAELRERYGPGHPRTAWAQEALGGAYDSYGKTEEARAALLKSIEIYEDFGEDPYSLATSLNGLASMYIRAGEYESARETAQRAVDTLRSAMQGDHVAISIAMSTLASAEDELGNGQRAIELYKDCLAMRRRIGAEPVMLLAPTANMGSAYHSLGDYDKGIEQYEQAVKIADEALPPEHPDRAFVRYAYGRLLLDAGDHEAAGRLFGIALPVFERRFGEGSRDTAALRLAMAEVERRRGRRAQARRLAERVLATPSLPDEERTEAQVLLGKLRGPAR